MCVVLAAIVVFAVANVIIMLCDFDFCFALCMFKLCVYLSFDYNTHAVRALQFD